MWFQSTPPHGRRHKNWRQLVHLDLDVSIHASAREATGRRRTCKSLHKVSIHASAREATTTSKSFGCAIRVSIHASAREATVLLPSIFTAPFGFNPRLRTGGDRSAGICDCHEKGFNPRLRTGGDRSEGSRPGHLRVSIHASAREATEHTGVSVRILTEVSIHASAREATRVPCRYCHNRISFNPRLRTGGDLKKHGKKCAGSCFNPRLRTGGDPITSK